MWKDPVRKRRISADGFRRPTWGAVLSSSRSCLTDQATVLKITAQRLFAQTIPERIPLRTPNNTRGIGELRHGLDQREGFEQFIEGAKSRPGSTSPGASLRAGKNKSCG